MKNKVIENLRQAAIKKLGGYVSIVGNEPTKPIQFQTVSSRPLRIRVNFEIKRYAPIDYVRQQILGIMSEKIIEENILEIKEEPSSVGPEFVNYHAEIYVMKPEGGEKNSGTGNIL